MHRTLLPLLLLPAASLLHAAASVTIEVDAAASGGPVRDLLGVNRDPLVAAQTAGTVWNGAPLYPAFGISQVRLHDTGVDLCGTYTAAAKLDTGTTPAQPVAGCTLTSATSRPRFNWTPLSSADAELNAAANYDFASADAAVAATLAARAAVYLRLGESYNGPNDTSDPVAWAKVATNIYRHVAGAFKPSAGIAVDPVFVEVHNEPDGGFWSGSAATFHTLFAETAQRVRAAAAAIGRSVKVGGAGFTRSVLTSSTVAGNPANGFIAAVGASTLDFYSAHWYGACARATLAEAAGFLRQLRALVDAQGGRGKPLHITEWNIGLGQQCGESLYADPRTQSYASGVLTLMQDPAHDVEAAHYYAAMPLMSLFNFSAAPGAVRINPSAWAFWAHSRLRGSTRIDARVCPNGTACVAGHAAESAPLLALAAQSGGGQRVVVTNDGAAAVSYALQLRNLGAGIVNATIHTPPGAARDVAASGNPVTPEAAALAALFAAVAVERRPPLAASGGRLELELTIPARSVQLVEITPVGQPTTAFADCLFAWAERGWPQFFAPAGAISQTFAPYHYRWYPGTQTYLATSTADADVWVLGPLSGQLLQSGGAAAGYAAAAGCATP